MALPGDLELLIRSRYPVIAVETAEEDRLEQALEAIGARLGIPVFVWTLTAGLKRRGHLNSIYDSQSPLKALNNVAARGDEAGIYLFKGIDRHLGDAPVVRKLQDLVPAFTSDRRAIVLSGASLTLPRELAPFAASLTLDLPTVDELRALARRVMADLSRRSAVRVELTAPEFERLVERLKGLTAFEAERALTRVALRDAVLSAADVDALVEIKKEMLGRDGLVEFFAPDEHLADVGGFRHLKAWLAKRKKAFEPGAKAFGVTAPKGLLLLGTQGCGKSLVAKAVAREWDLPLLKLETARLYDKFVGESEKNLDKALRIAEHMAPCVLMIDEIEKALAYGGSADADGGLSRRVFGRLLGWLQDRTAPVFVVATCNQVSDLPPELMRKGRFDEVFFIDLPDEPERREIFAVHLRKRDRDPAGFDLAALAAASSGFSGAEIEQAVVSALYTAFSRSTAVTTDVVLEELRATRPLSVTRKEEIDALREWAHGRTVTAS